MYTVVLEIDGRRVEIDVDREHLPPFMGIQIYDPDGMNLIIEIRGFWEEFSSRYRRFVGAMPCPVRRAKTLLVTGDIFTLPARCPDLVLDVREIYRKEPS